MSGSTNVCKLSEITNANDFRRKTKITFSDLQIECRQAKKVNVIKEITIEELRNGNFVTQKRSIYVTETREEEVNTKITKVKKKN